jgi:3-dehydroquinate dehydratase II
MRPIVYVLNGPNLNLLGTRQPEIYRRETLSDVEAECRRLGADLGLEIEFRQTNAEFQLIDWIHESRERAAGIVINPAAFSHTSVAVLDALKTCEVPILEVHISNIHQREEFRQHSFVSRVAEGTICGFGTQGYVLAIQRLARRLGSSQTPTTENQGSFLVGLIGAGIQSSRSPALHEREGAAQGLRYMYQLIDLTTLRLGVEALDELITAAQRMSFAGLNITHPCKQLVIPLLDDLSDDARALGAVNTVVLKDGKRVGHNTDWFGFAENFRRGLPLSADLLRSDLWVAEIIYFPMETELLRTARALGCRTLDGGGMTVFQAAEAFRLFTGIEPDAQRMLQHFAAMSAKDRGLQG